MKKTLLVFLICLSVLTVFASCVLWPKEPEVKEYTITYDEGSETVSYSEQPKKAVAGSTVRIEFSGNSTTANSVKISYQEPNGIDFKFNGAPHTGGEFNTPIQGGFIIDGDYITFVMPEGNVTVSFGSVPA